MLNAIGWDTHSSPAMGRPQDIVNSQVVERADLLIAVFWTRHGTPTGTAASGTIEEIESHLSRGKPAMFYFSSVPVEPSSVDPEQLSALQRFKRDIMKRSLIESYDSAEELRQKLTRQLARIVETALAPGATSLRQETERAPGTRPALSKEAQELLVEVAKDRNGHLLKVRTMGGSTVQTNGKSFGTRGESRSEALWEAAVFELRDAKLLQDRAHKGEVFSMTNEGYRVADLLAAHD